VAAYRRASARKSYNLFKASQTFTKHRLYANEFDGQECAFLRLYRQYCKVISRISINYATRWQSGAARDKLDMPFIAQQQGHISQSP
jgi:hypothetical protein